MAKAFMTLDDGTEIELSREQFFELLEATGAGSEFIVGENHGEAWGKIVRSLWPELVESKVLRELAGEGLPDKKLKDRWVQWTKRPIPGTHAHWRHLAHWVGIDAPKDVTDEWIEGELLPALTAKKQCEAEAVGVAEKLNVQGGTSVDTLERISAIERQQRKPPKQLTKREKNRKQRNDFSCKRRTKKTPDTWGDIYNAYNKKNPNDKDASPDTLRHSHDRNCTKCREDKS